jgi:hypothetical protein
MGKMRNWWIAAGLTSILGCISVAWAIQSTPTPLVAPETGEASIHQAEILDMARFKPGQCTLTTTGSEAAQTGTCNGASGVITSGFTVTVVSNAVDVMTITNSKVQAGDICIAMVDDTGAAAASVLEAASCRVSASQILVRLTNASATSPAVAAKVYFLIATKGNPN